MKKIITKKKAFTLIEVLVACAILIILVSAVVALGLTIINNTMLSRERTTAYYLGQEGIETIRQIRDSNLLDSNDQTSWNSLVINSNSDSSYQKPNDNGTTTYGLKKFNNRNRLFLEPNNYEMISVDGVDYKRKITFVPAGISVPDVVIGANAMRAIVTIDWKFKGNSKTVEVRELITNWKQQL